MVTVKESWEDTSRSASGEYDNYESYNKIFEDCTLEEVRGWCQNRMKETFPNRQYYRFLEEYRYCPKSNNEREREIAKNSWITDLDKYHSRCTKGQCNCASDELIMQEHDVFSTFEDDDEQYFLENTEMYFRIYQDGTMLETIDIKDFDEEFRKNEWPALFEANVKRMEEIQAQEKEKKLKEEEKRKEEEAKKKENEERILLEALKKKFEATT